MAKHAYESRSWEQDPDELRLIPKSRRRKILPTYEAAVPASFDGNARHAAVSMHAGWAFGEIDYALIK